jgi:uncharacterized protein DUF3198
MADSKRRTGGKPKRSGSSPERLTTANLVINAIATFVGAPLLFAGAVLTWLGTFGNEQNQGLFLGAVLALIGVFVILLCGLKVWEHLKARRRFNELLEGDKKSALVQNLEELHTLARSLGPPYRRRLESRLGEMGIKR